MGGGHSGEAKGVLQQLMTGVDLDKRATLPTLQPSF